MLPKPADWAGVFEVEAKEKELKELEAAMSSPDFWRNRAEADAKIKRLGEIKSILDRYASLEASVKALSESPDKAETVFFEARKKLRELETEMLFTGQYDKQSAVISIFPGAGGDDASDWARMLEEMYAKYASRRGWKTAMLDDNPNRRAFEVKGENAYGYLKRESGVHRLVRISPFSAQKLRHTSFALVEVVPDLPQVEEKKIQIPEKDLKADFYRASGPGGQNVNKVETAVRVTHLPTGLTASSSAERSQSQNREKALKHLKAKLIRLMEEHKTEEMDKLRTKAKPDFGHAIRHYFLHPYQLVKDDRTGAETSQAERVLDGDIDIFVEAEVELPGKNPESRN